MNATPQKLPIGIQSFSEMRRNGYIYVDKTPLIHQLVDRGKYYFLSRPRRFGKSLLLDTLDCAFSGRKELFTGLFLGSGEANWNWEQKSPVLRIDFSGGTIDSRSALESRLHSIIDSWQSKYGPAPSPSGTGGIGAPSPSGTPSGIGGIGAPSPSGTPSGTAPSPSGGIGAPSPSGTGGIGAPSPSGAHVNSPGHRLLDLVPAIRRKTNEQVVVLVDEYDKPITDNLNSPDSAEEIRDGLRDFYSAIKPLDEHIRFVLLTGVSKFAKAGIFSGLNNLHDITLSRRYSTLCGYTQTDLETCFADHLENFDKDMVREWYNGYSWTGEAVYNPFDILLLFEESEYRAWWFETGTPWFLAEILRKNPRTLPDLEGMDAGDDILGSFEIHNQQPESLLFQTGYLTVKSVSSNGQTGTRYTLGFPNREVREAFSRLMLTVLNGPDAVVPHHSLRQIIEQGDSTALHREMKPFFASIPYTWHTKSPIGSYEGYYASIVYAYFASLGYEIIPEDTTNRGRADMTVKSGRFTWILEFKVKKLDKSGDKSPLQQIKERGYAEKYLSRKLPVIQVGIVFDPESRTIESWETETREVK